MCEYKDLYFIENGKIYDYIGLYIVTSDGNVLSNNKKKNKLLKKIMDCNGYEKVALYDKNHVKKFFMIHRLVAHMFVPNTENKPQVDHIDTNRRNNNYTNLRWATNKENCNNPLSLEKTKKSKHGALHNRATPIIATNIETGEKIYFGYMSQAKEMGFLISKVSLCCYGKRKSHKGYTFEFLEKELE